MSPISIGGSDETWTEVTTSNIANFDWKIGDKIMGIDFKYYYKESSNASSSDSGYFEIHDFVIVVSYIDSKIMMGIGSGNLTLRVDSGGTTNGEIAQVMIPLVYSNSSSTIGIDFVTEYGRSNWTNYMPKYYLAYTSSNNTRQALSMNLYYTYNMGTPLGVYTTATPL